MLENVIAKKCVRASQMRKAKVEGRGISRWEVYTGVSKYDKVMPLNFSEAKVDRGCGGNWWMTPSGLIV